MASPKMVPIEQSPIQELSFSQPTATYQDGQAPLQIEIPSAVSQVTEREDLDVGVVTFDRDGIV